MKYFTFDSIKNLKSNIYQSFQCAKIKFLVPAKQNAMK